MPSTAASCWSSVRWTSRPHRLGGQLGDRPAPDLGDLCAHRVTPVSAIDIPARMAVLQSMLRQDLLPAEFALNQAVTQVGGAVGPALAALLIAQFSLAATTAGAVLFVLSALTMIGVRPLRPEVVHRGRLVVDEGGSPLSQGPAAHPVVLPDRPRRHDLRMPAPCSPPSGPWSSAAMQRRWGRSSPPPVSAP